MRSSVLSVPGCVYALAMSLSTSPAVADDTQTCRQGAGDGRIAACTRVIDSARAQGNGLASAYLNRGIAYRENDDPDRALADLDQAIRLDPKLAEAYRIRGIVYYYKGEFDRAIAEQTQAIRLDRTLAHAFNARGV